MTSGPMVVPPNILDRDALMAFLCVLCAKTEKTPLIHNRLHKP